MAEAKNALGVAQIFFRLQVWKKSDLLEVKYAHYDPSVATQSTLSRVLNPMPFGPPLDDASERRDPWVD